MLASSSCASPDEAKRSNILSSARRKGYNIYSKLPPVVKENISRLIGLLPPRYIYGRHFLSTLKSIRDTEYLSRKELDRIQEDRLRITLLNAYRNTEYYNREMAARRIGEEMIVKSPLVALRLMGFTDKRKIADNLQSFLSRQMHRIPHDYTSTGGTLGEPFYFYMDSDRSSQEWAFMVDQWSRVGFSLKSRRATFRGSRIDGKGWEDDWITRERKFSSFELTDDYLKRVWPLLHEFRPNYIYAYPSTALHIARFMEKSGRDFPQSVKGILLGSENIYQGQKLYIEQLTRRRVFLWYGHSEKLVLAGFCEKTDNYHAYPQYGYVEFINEKGENAKFGEFAEIVGTGFINTVLPFIRYRTGDYCTYLGGSCPECGRNYYVFSSVSGRWTQEVLYGRHGNPIPMSAINLHSDVFQNVFRFQFYQEKKGEAILRLVPKAGFTEDDRAKIENEINRKFNGSVVVITRTVDNIPLTERGKYKFIDQQLEMGS